MSISSLSLTRSSGWTISTVGSTSRSFNVSASVTANQYYRLTVTMGGKTVINTGWKAGSSTFAYSFAQTDAQSLSHLDTGSSFNVITTLKEYYTEASYNSGASALFTVTTTNTFSVNIAPTSASITSFDADSVQNISVSWTKPSSLGSWRARVQVFVNGTRILNRYDFAGSSMSYPVDQTLRNQIIDLMGGVTPAALSVTVTSGFLAGSVVYAGSRSASGSVTKVFAKAASVSISGDLRLPSATFSSVTITQSGPTAGITYDLSLSLSGTVIGTNVGISSAGQYNISINTTTAASKLTSSLGVAPVITCTTKYNGSVIGTASATGGLIKPAYPTGFSTGTPSLTSISYSFSSYSSGFVYKGELYIAGTYIKTITLGSSGNVEYTSADILNRVDSERKADVTIKFLTYEGANYIVSSNLTKTYGPANTPGFSNSIGSGTLDIQSNFTFSVSGSNSGFGLSAQLKTISGTTLKTWNNLSNNLSSSFSTAENKSLYATLGSSLNTTLKLHYNILRPNGGVLTTSVVDLKIGTIVAQVSSISNYEIGSSTPISLNPGTTRSLLNYKVRLFSPSINGTWLSVASNTTSIRDDAFSEALLSSLPLGSTSVSNIKLSVETYYESTKIGSTQNSSGSATASTSSAAINAPDSIVLYDSSLTVSAQSSFSGFTYTYKFSISGQNLPFEKIKTSDISYQIDFTNISNVEEVYKKVSSINDSVILVASLETYFNNTKIGNTETKNITVEFKRGSLSNVVSSIDQNLSFIFQKINDPNLTTEITIPNFPVLKQTIDVTNESSPYIFNVDSSLREFFVSRLTNNDNKIVFDAVLKTKYNNTQIGTNVAATITIQFQKGTLAPIAEVLIESPFSLLVQSNTYDQLEYEVQFYVYNTENNLEYIKTSILEEGENVLSFNTEDKELIYSAFSSNALDINSQVSIQAIYTDGNNNVIEVGERTIYSTKFRAPVAQFSLPSSFTIEESFDIDVDLKSNVLESDIHIYQGSNLLQDPWEKVTNYTGLSLDLNSNEVLYNLTKTSTSIPLMIQVRRYHESEESGKVFIGPHLSREITARVADNIVPSISGVSISDKTHLNNKDEFGVIGNPTILEYIGAFVQGNSKIRIDIGALTSFKSAYLKEIFIKVPGIETTIDLRQWSASETNQINNFFREGSIVNNSGRTEGRIVLTDSRNRSVTYLIEDILVLPYEEPSLEGIDIYRINLNTGDKDLSGGIYAETSFRINLSYLPLELGSSLSSKNKAILKIYGVDSFLGIEDSLWQTITILDEVISEDLPNFLRENQQYVIEEEDSSAKEFDGSVVFTVYLELVDLFNKTVRMELTLPTIDVPLSISRHGIAIREIRTGEESEHESIALIVNGESLFRKTLIIEEDTLAPLVVNSSVLVNNLNAEFLNNKPENYFINIEGGTITGILNIERNDSDQGDIYIQGISSLDIFQKFIKTTTFNELSTNLHFQSNSPIKIKFGNDEISITQNDSSIAEFSNHTLYTNRQEISEELKIYNFAFLPRAGGLSFTKIN